MNDRIYLDCSGLHNIRLEGVPNSIYLDAEVFLRNFQSILDQINYVAPLRKVKFRTGFGKTLSGWMDGSFHRWGDDMLENTEGQAFVNMTVAIIEDKYGNLYKIDPIQIQFVKEW